MRYTQMRMLIIRSEQMRAFESAELARWIGAHVREFFPVHCRALGTTGVVEMVREGISKAAAWGFTEPRHCCQYVAIMFLFGEDFDRREKWVAEVLNEEPSLPPAARMAGLFDAARARLRRLAGQGS